MSLIDKQDIKNFAIAITASVAPYYVVGNYTIDFPFVGFLSTNPEIVPIIFILIFVVGRKMRRKKGGSYLFPIAFPVEPPPILIKKIIQYPEFGVNWKSQVTWDGKVYVKGPYCPECDYKLDRKEKSKLFGWSSKKVWHCANCKIDYPRPSEYLYKEDEVVKKKVESDLRSEGLGD